MLLLCELMGDYLYKETYSLNIVFFFFQAEDGIRDYKVTGVQTCALPISTTSSGPSAAGSGPTRARPAAAPPSRAGTSRARSRGRRGRAHGGRRGTSVPAGRRIRSSRVRRPRQRSEERRGGEEGRSRWSPY